MKKPQRLESLHVVTVPSESPCAAETGSNEEEEHNAMVKKMEGEHGDEMSVMATKMTSPVAFPRLPIDRYGFLISDKNSQKTAVWLENRRTQKWVKMIGKQLEDWEVCQLKDAAILKKRIRKGIPEALRGRVWCHLVGSMQMMINNPGVYHEFLQSKQAPCEETIARDIGRTFPKHYLFNERTSLGQCALMNVLKVYSLHDPEVGYCQGMGFLSAMFLSYMPEEQSFWHLVACLNHKRYDLANLYRPRMPKVPELIYIFEKLMEQLMPQVAKHLESEGLHPTMYLTQWFITLLTYNFPFEFVTRVWDMFLYEGWKIIFRVALALMKISQSEVAFLMISPMLMYFDVDTDIWCRYICVPLETLLSIKFEGIMEFFRELPTKVGVVICVDTEEVLVAAFRLPLKRIQIEQLRERYQQSIASSK
ncbi:Evi5 protein, partial [Globisporangium splendens]